MWIQKMVPCLLRGFRYPLPFAILVMRDHVRFGFTSIYWVALFYHDAPRDALCTDLCSVARSPVDIGGLEIYLSLKIKYTHT